jgi:short-subunit dehydrogenase involved in D-alanine esterification of teichoic acids
VGDVASRDFRKSLVKKTVEKFGKINVLVSMMSE